MGNNYSFLNLLEFYFQTQQNMQGLMRERFKNKR